MDRHTNFINGNAPNYLIGGAPTPTLQAAPAPAPVGGSSPQLYMLQSQQYPQQFQPQFQPQFQQQYQPQYSQQQLLPPQSPQMQAISAVMSASNGSFASLSGSDYRGAAPPLLMPMPSPPQVMMMAGGPPPPQLMQPGVPYPQEQQQQQQQPSMQNGVGGGYWVPAVPALTRPNPAPAPIQPVPLMPPPIFGGGNVGGQTSAIENGYQPVPAAAAAAGLPQLPGVAGTHQTIHHSSMGSGMQRLQGVKLPLEGLVLSAHYFPTPNQQRELEAMGCPKPPGGHGMTAAQIPDLCCMLKVSGIGADKVCRNHCAGTCDLSRHAGCGMIHAPAGWFPVPNEICREYQHHRCHRAYCRHFHGTRHELVELHGLDVTLYCPYRLPSSLGRRAGRTSGAGASKSAGVEAKESEDSLRETHPSLPEQGGDAVQHRVPLQELPEPGSSLPSPLSSFTALPPSPNQQAMNGVAEFHTKRSPQQQSQSPSASTSDRHIILTDTPESATAQSPVPRSPLLATCIEPLSTQE